MDWKNLSLYQKSMLSLVVLGTLMMFSSLSPRDAFAKAVLIYFGGCVYAYSITMFCSSFPSCRCTEWYQKVGIFGLAGLFACVFPPTLMVTITNIHAAPEFGQVFWIAWLTQVMIGLICFLTGVWKDYYEKEALLVNNK